MPGIPGPGHAVWPSEAGLKAKEEELLDLAGVVGGIQDSGDQITEVGLKSRLRGVGITAFKNLDAVAGTLQKHLDDVNAQRHANAILVVEYAQVCYVSVCVCVLGDTLLHDRRSRTRAAGETDGF